MKEVVLTADDFGLTPGVNQGILEAHRAGLVNRASIMSTGLAFVDAVALARAHPTLAVGLHVALTCGRPASPMPALTNPDGAFRNRPWRVGWRMLLHVLPVGQVEQELRAQIERPLALGLRPAHLDSHHHIHLLPGLLPMVLRLAREYEIPALRLPDESAYLRAWRLRGRRAPAGGSVAAGPGAAALGRSLVITLLARRAAPLIRAAGFQTADAFLGIAFHWALPPAQVVQTLRYLPEGRTEIACHPGHPDPLLRQLGLRLVEQRAAELQALSQPWAREALGRAGLQGTCAQEAR